MGDRIDIIPGFVRNSMQATTWTDARGHVHAIATMETSHAANAYSYLRSRAVDMSRVWLVTIAWMSERGMQVGPLPPELVAAARDEPRRWVEMLPVMLALRSRFRRPDYVRPAAPESDEF